MNHLKDLYPVLITGAHGQLGSELADRLRAGGRVVAVGRDELDICDAGQARAFTLALAPRLIVNCAAFNDVDGAEAAPLAAMDVNANAVWTLASLAAELDALFVHYSSHFVFDGAQRTPYAEEDLPRPESVYGMSKLLGERGATAAPRHFVVRLSSVYGGARSKGYVQRIATLAESGQRVPAFVDRTVSPSYIPDVVDNTLALIRGEATHGIYHCASADHCTWHDLAAHALDRLGRPDLLVPTRFVASAFRAPRPQHCALSVQKLQQVTSGLRSWRDALDEHLARHATRATAP